MMNKWKSAFGVQKKSAFCDDDFEESDVIESLAASAQRDRVAPSTRKWKSVFGIQKESAFCDDDCEESDVIESLSASALSDRMTPNTHGVPARTDSESVKKESDFMGFPSGTAHPAPFRSAFVRNRHAAYIEDEEDEDDVSEAGLANLLASASESAASRCHTECGDVSKVVTFGCADIWNDRPLQKIASPRPEEEGQRRPSLDLPGTPGYRDGKWVL